MLELTAQSNNTIPKIETTSASKDYISIYQKFLSDIRGNSCPMFPSCSNYGEEVFEKFNGFKAFSMTSDRLMRCGHERNQYHLTLSSGEFKLLDLPTNADSSKNLIYRGNKKTYNYGDYAKDPPIKRFIKNLINNQAFHEALLEIRRLEFFDADKIDKEIFINKLIAFEGLGQLENGVFEYENTKNYIFKNDVDVISQVASMYYKLYNFEKALEYCELGIKISDDDHNLTQFLKVQGLSNAQLGFWNIAEKSFTQIGNYNNKLFDKTSVIMRDKNAIKIKSATTAGLLSIIPGGGYFYTGNKATALTSLMINGLLAYATYTNINNRNYGTAIFTGLFNLSFYIGNMQGSIKSANRYNLIKNQKIIHKMERALNF